MKCTEDIAFALVKRNKEIKNSLIRTIKKAFSVNKVIFKKNPKKFTLVICDTESEFKGKTKYYYQEWQTAVVLRNNKLVIKSPKFIEKIGRWKRKDFLNVLTHEMNHIFWYSMYKTWSPNWLAEGLACHVGKNFILTKKELGEIVRKYNVDSSILSYRYLKRNFGRGHLPRYPIWANFTKYISKRHSTQKLIKLMNKYAKEPRKENYEKAFKLIFRKSEKELFNEFLVHIQT